MRGVRHTFGINLIYMRYCPYEMLIHTDTTAKSKLYLHVIKELKEKSAAPLQQKKSFLFSKINFSIRFL